MNGIPQEYFATPISDAFQCPICYLVLNDAVISNEGFTFCRSCIMLCIATRPVCPLSHKPLSSTSLFPNRVVQKFISEAMAKCSNSYDIVQYYRRNGSITRSNRSNIISRDTFHASTADNEVHPLDSIILPQKCVRLTYTFRYKDQGWGNMKGAVYLRLMRDNTEVERKQLGPIALHEWTVQAGELLSESSSIISKSNAKDKLEVGYICGGGGGHQIYINDLYVMLDYRVVIEPLVDAAEEVAEEYCPWQGPYDQMEQHRRDCPFESIPCLNSGCGELVKRRSLPQHQERCIYRSVNCEFCEKEMQWCVLTDHLVSCELRPVGCPNERLGCPISAMPQRELRTHLAACPFEVLTCPVAKAIGEVRCGLTCEGQVMRKNLESHLELSDPAKLKRSLMYYASPRAMSAGPEADSSLSASSSSSSSSSSSESPATPVAYTTIVEDSPIGFSRSFGAAEIESDFEVTALFSNSIRFANF